MLAPTKKLLAFKLNLLTTGTARRLRDPRAPLAEQARAFKELTGQFAGTAYGRECGLEAGLSFAQFQARVPLRTYEGFTSYIDRMKHGEAGVLWPGRCSFYAATPGTATGRAKHLPVTEEMLAHFSQAGLDALLHYTARTGHTGVFRGRHLFLGDSATLTQLEEAKPHSAYVGDLGGITALNLPPREDKHLYEPGLEIARIADWPARLRAVADRTVGRDITLVAGLPGWLPMLAETVCQRVDQGKARPAHLQAVWPNLECVVHGGMPAGPYLDELRALFGPTVNFHEVYSAAEGCIAVQDAEAALGLRLMTGAGLFFEFLPMRFFDENNLARLGEKTVPLDGVQPGEDYALVLTTPAGLCRYVLGDVVRFVSIHPPRLLCQGRTQLRLGAFGEQVSERELSDALAAVCHRHSWAVVNFHVAPVFTGSLTGERRGRHEWWIELRPRSVETPTGPLIAAETDLELQRLSADYESRRKGGGLEPPVVRLVMPGVFEHWMRAKGQWGGRHKMPRCRPDRAVADELAQLTRFSAGS